MKKIILVTAIFCGLFQAQAQKANIQSAISYLKDNDFENAKKMIDEATKSESTKSNAKAWFLKGVIYQAIGTPASEQMPFIQFKSTTAMGDEAGIPVMLEGANKFAAQHPDAIELALEAYRKAMEFNPKYDKEEYFFLLQSMAYGQFNNGASKMNESKFAEAKNSFLAMNQIASLDNGKVFKDQKSMDTLFAFAKMYQGNCAYQMNQLDEALPIIESCLANPITQKADVYMMAAEIYEGKGNETKLLEVLGAAKAKFPNDKRILNSEINYYLKSGKAEESIKKLKEGIAADPKNEYLYINLGQLMYNMANPLDKSGKFLPKPTNSADLEKDAIANYNKALELNGNNYYPQYYLGLLYYNKAKEMTDEMNKADDKKYMAMKPERDNLINKAIPFLEKAKTLIDAEGVSDSNKEVYKQSVAGLVQSYNLTNQTEKASALQKLLDTK